MMRWAANRLLELCAAVFLLMAGMWAFYSSTPVTYWFEYSGITVVTPAKQGEPLFFRSKILGLREVNVEWVDVLQCRSGNGVEFRQLNRVETSGRILVQSPNVGRIWRFGPHDAQKGDSCFLRSIITVHLPLGVDRTVLVDGTLFTVE